MKTQKKLIIEVIDSLPEDTTLDDAIYVLYMHSKLIKSKKSIEDGKFVTLEDLDKEMEAKYENYSLRTSKTRHG